MHKISSHLERISKLVFEASHPAVGSNWKALSLGLTPVSGACTARGVLALLALALSVSVISGCGMSEFSGSSSRRDDDVGLRGKLVITGSSTVAPLMQEIAARFEESNDGVRVDVQTGGSSRGIRDAQTGAADIGMSSRALKQEELESVEATVVAWDGVAFVVHQDNQVSHLSTRQLRDIYMGNVTSWNQVGGAAGQIVVSNRAHGRSELDLVSEFLEVEPGQIKADVVDGETQQSLKTVINNKQAITYTSIGAAQDAIKRGAKIRLLPLNQVAASSETVQSGEFPLARPLVLIRKNRPSDKAKKAELISAFLEFSTSDKVTKEIKGLGFVGPKSSKSQSSNRLVDLSPPRISKQ